MQRLEYKDEMQGLAIFLVVLGHFVGPHTYGNTYPLTEIIASCHMSFFFFLSGYINDKTNHIKDRGTMAYIKKKAQALLIPFLFWSYIAVFFKDDFIPTTLSEWVEPLLVFPNRHFWFLPVLFIFSIIYLLMNKLIASRSIGWGRIAFYAIPVLSFSFFGFATHQYHLVIYGIYLASFFLGDYLSCNEQFRKFILRDGVYGLSATILFVAWKIYPLEANGVAWKSLVNLILSFVCSYTMCVFCYNFFRKVTLPTFFKRCLQEMGKMSLVIYVTPFVLLSPSFTFPDSYSETLINVISMLMTAIYVFMSYTWGMFIYQIPIVRFIMYGKK